MEKNYSQSHECIQIITNTIKKLKNINDIDSITRLVSETETRCNEILIEEDKKKLEKENSLKDKLDKLKKPLKNIDSFHKKYSENFETEFNKVLMDGFNLCAEYEQDLKDTKWDLKGSSVDIGQLQTLIDAKTSLSSITKNYLYFMIDQIKVCEYYLDENIKSETKKIKDTEFDASITEKKIDESIEQVTDKEIREKLNALKKKKDYCDNDTIDMLRGVLQCGLKRNLCTKENWEQRNDLVKKNSLKMLHDLLIKSLDLSEPDVIVRDILRWKLSNDTTDTTVVKFEPLDKKPMWNISKNSIEITDDDLHQGKLGDCWLIAVLRSIVLNNSKLILDCFPKRDTEVDEDGLVKGKNITVRLWKVMLSGHMKDLGFRTYARTFGKYVDIEMDATITEGDYGNIATVCWPRFIEKAMSISRTLKNIVYVDDTSNKDDILKIIFENVRQEWNRSILHWNECHASSNYGITQAVLTGKTSGQLSCKKFNEKTNKYEDMTFKEMFNRMPKNTLFDYIKKQVKNKKHISVACHTTFECNEYTIVPNDHTYSLVDAYEEKNEKYIKILNPYNSEDRYDDSTKKLSANNKIIITYEQFIENFKQINR